MAIQQFLQLPQVKTMEVFRLSNCGFLAFLGTPSGDVEEGPGERRDRNATPHGHLVWSES
jgi:hypothetical protein